MDVPAEWEAFSDPAYYDMWCVRRKGSQTFGDGFHVTSKAEAEALIEALLAERVSATERAAKIAERHLIPGHTVGVAVPMSIAAAIRSQP